MNKNDEPRYPGTHELRALILAAMSSRIPVDIGKAVQLLDAYARSVALSEEVPA